MSLNWKEINVLLRELSLENCYIEEWQQPDFRNIYLKVFHPQFRYWVRFCFEGARTCMHACRSKPLRPAKPLRFCDFLRSRYRNGRIVEASQPGNDRIVLLRVLRQKIEMRLYFRLWGGSAGNIIATDKHDVIVDMLYRKKHIHIGDIFTLSPSSPPENVHVRSYNKETSSFNEEIERDAQQNDTTLEKLQKDFKQFCKKRKAYFLRSIAELEKQFQEYDLIRQYQYYGDCILSRLDQCKTGDSILHMEENNITITMNTALTPVENAQSFYKQARSIKEKLQHGKQKLAQVKKQQKYFEQEIAKIREDSTDSLREALKHLKADSVRKRKEEDPSSPGLLFYSAGFTISVGRNARENDLLLRKYTRGNDIWMHTRDYPGSYVFIHVRQKKQPPLDVLLDAASIALFFSKGRRQHHADMYYTQVKYLRRAKHGVFGSVIPKQEKNMHITLTSARLVRLGVTTET